MKILNNGLEVREWKRLKKEIREERWRMKVLKLNQ